MAARDSSGAKVKRKPRHWLLCALFFVLGVWSAAGLLFWIGFASLDDLWGHLTCY